MKKRIQPLKIASVAVISGIALYLAASVYCFNVLSAPARSWDGWLGPLERRDSKAIDIGKAWHTDAPNHSLYRTFSPICYLRLRVQGLSPGQ
ncbi:MAG TPA: hypothetical protein VFZ59_06090 [Verrucomicrobiae bacterium]|nr:hypothetical protein [Verrucomicrobiae bacterium]